jgi:hypothetical protein
MPSAECYFTNANIRTGPPDPPSNFIGAAITIAPLTGT